MIKHHTLPFAVDEADGSLDCAAGTAIEAGVLWLGHFSNLCILSTNIVTMGDFCAYFHF
jgi:hypothetical protein